MIRTAGRPGPAGTRDITVHVFPTGDHLLLGDEPGGWPRMQGYVPGYFDLLVRWVRQRAGLPPCREGACGEGRR